jgi:hypothetical protein
MAQSAERCRKLARFLTAGKVTFEEYAYNVTLEIVNGPIDNISKCVELIPFDLVTLYADYLRTSLEPVDFMPSPGPFLTGDASEEQIDHKKRQLRPNYLRLHQLMCDKTT